MSDAQHPVFKLKRPCANCPWRKDVARFLSPERYRELAAVVLLNGESFHCHKTVDYSEPEGQIVDTSKLCAGAMIMARKLGSDLQIVQIAQRLGIHTEVKLDMEAPVYDTLSGFVTGSDNNEEANSALASTLRTEHAQKLREKL